MPWIGRRKSWIVPLQIVSSMMLYWLSIDIDEQIKDRAHIYSLTFYSFVLVFMYATQDIAVDGWALEILLPQNKSLASTS